MKEGASNPSDVPPRPCRKLARSIREIGQFIQLQSKMACATREDEMAAKKLWHILHDRVGGFLTLVVTENRVNYLNLKKRGNQSQLHIHRAFLEAPQPVLDALGDLLVNPKNVVPALVRDFVRQAARKALPAPAPTPKPRSLRPVGRVQDLRPIFERLNHECFNGQVSAGLTWGRSSGNRSVRRRRLGSFNRRTRVISLHPVLDSSRVPKYYLRYILFHEMLHALQPPDARRFHDAAFRRAMRTFPEYDRARRWEKEHLDLLGLRSPRRKG